MTQTEQLVKLITDYGVQNADAIVAAEQMPNRPTLPRCLAMIENETGGANIFGHEGLACPAEWWGKEVTQSRYTTYKLNRERLFREGVIDGVDNGVGPTQLTGRSIELEAQALGGCWIPRFNCDVGFHLLHELITAHGVGPGFRWYNGGGQIDSEDEGYEQRAVERAGIWEQRLRDHGLA
jgi:hypothetical protein